MTDAELIEQARHESIDEDGNVTDDMKAALADALERRLGVRPLPADVAVARAAQIIADSTLIDAPKLPAECWHGLARSILAGAATPLPEDVAGLVEKLYEDARATAKATTLIADTKSSRNQSAGDLDASYRGLNLEETTEWKAAALIASQAREIGGLQASLRVARAQIHEGDDRGNLVIRYREQCKEQAREIEQLTHEIRRHATPLPADVAAFVQALEHDGESWAQPTFNKAASLISVQEREIDRLVKRETDLEDALEAAEASAQKERTSKMNLAEAADEAVREIKTERDAIGAATFEECAKIALEQRCERGTPWDEACLAVARSIRVAAPTR